MIPRATGVHTCWLIGKGLRRADPGKDEEVGGARDGARFLQVTTVSIGKAHHNSIKQFCEV